jgi:hypothetical protein
VAHGSKEERDERPKKNASIASRCDRSRIDDVDRGRHRLGYDTRGRWCRQKRIDFADDDRCVWNLGILGKRRRRVCRYMHQLRNQIRHQRPFHRRKRRGTGFDSDVRQLQPYNPCAEKWQPLDPMDFWHKRNRHFFGSRNHNGVDSLRHLLHRQNGRRNADRHDHRSQIRYCGDACESLVQPVMWTDHLDRCLRHHKPKRHRSGLLAPQPKYSVVLDSTELAGYD